MVALSYIFEYTKLDTLKSACMVKIILDFNEIGNELTGTVKRQTGKFDGFGWKNEL